MKRVSCCGRCSNFAGVLLSQFVAFVTGSHRLSARLRRTSPLAAAWLLSLGVVLASTASAQTYTGVLSGTAVTLPLPSGVQPDPWGVAVDGAGNVYVTDYSNSQVLMETPSGNGYTESAIITSGLNHPNGIAVDASGNLYIVDSGNVRVVKETLSGGSYTLSVIATSTNGLGAPVAVAVDGGGNVYIADQGSGAIPSAVYKETAQGNSYSQTVVGSGLNWPSAIAVDAKGNVYIADSNNSRILMETPASNSYSQTAIVSGLSDPTAVAVDSSGNVYFATQGTNYYGTGQVFRASQQAGSYTQVPLGASLGGIWGLAVDTNGNLYAANNQNHWLMKDAPSTGGLATVNVGSTSPLTAIYTFGSAVTLGSITVSTQGASSLDFVDAHTGSCSVNSTYYAADSCTVRVNFAPLASGPRYGGIVLLDNSSNVIATAYLEGTGIAPQVNFAPGTKSVLPTSALAYPWGMATDASGSIYIADTNNNRVLKETNVGGSYSESTVGTGLDGPEGVAVDGAGNVYIADSVSGNLYKETLIGGSYSQSEILEEMENISGVAVDGSGNLYVADPSNDQVLKEVPNSSGGYDQSTVGNELTQPYGVAVDAFGDVYVADTGNSRVLIETPSAGSYVQNVVAENDAVPISPNGVAVDGNLNVYIADNNNRILKETPSGDGTYTETVLSNPDTYPWGIAADSAGNVYVVEANGDGGINEVVKLDYADASSVSFGSTEGNGGAQTLAIANFGNAPLHFPAPSSGKNPSISANFTLTSNQSGNCPLVSSGSSAAQLAPNASCLLTMSFTPDPTLSGSVNGQLVLKDDAMNAPGYITQSIGLSGTATATATLPTLSSPTPGSTLGSSATFTWTTGTGISSYRLQLGSTGVGANDLYDSGWKTATSVTVNSIPSSGVTVFVRLYSMISGIEHWSDYTFTESGTPSPAVLTAPVVGSTLGTSATFTWTKGTGPSQYMLWLGTVAPGSYNLYNSGALTGASTTVTNIPTSGVTVYARLFSRINGTWQTSDYTFTESGTPTPAVLTAPTLGSKLSSSATFTWTTGSGPSEYELWLGTVAPRTYNLYNSGVLTGTSATVSSIPTTGVTLYVTLLSRISGAWQYSDYTFTESGTPTPAVLTAPTVGSTLASSATFTWTTGSGPSEYMLWLGTIAPGTYNLYNSGALTGTSTTVTNIPTSGVTVYARLFSRINGTWQTSDYTFTESGTPTPAVLTAPTVGSTLASSATFTWTTGSGPSEYMLTVGTTGAGSSSLYSSGVLLGTSTTVTIPSNGVKVYVRLYSRISGAWQSSDYIFMESGAS